ncbi:MAG TPA: hypothetical protein DCX07_09525 [Phycisphaerales bacterium]|nr:hypothetical protein [Phycisphaerales bacterium]
MTAYEETTQPEQIRNRPARDRRTLTPLSLVQSLLIDVDDTVVTALGDQGRREDGQFNTASLFNVLQSAAVHAGKLSAEETERRIQAVKDRLRWWDWGDFLQALDLDAREFWEYAYRIERQFIGATGPEVPQALRRLRQAGFRLYAASNNPDSGIRHKLRLAGITPPEGPESLFSGLLAVSRLKAMKWEPEYWTRALSHIRHEPHEVAVVGDNLHDDFAVPHSVGINYSFILVREPKPLPRNQDGVLFVRSFDEVAEVILS